MPYFSHAYEVAFIRPYIINETHDYVHGKSQPARGVHDSAHEIYNGISDLFHTYNFATGALRLSLSLVISVPDHASETPDHDGLTDLTE